MKKPYKMKVCIVCVCFNAYQDAIKLLNSLSDAYEYAVGIELWVVMSDNSTNYEGVEIIESDNFKFNYKYLKNQNIGYFPAFNKGFCSLQKSHDYFDYVIVSNVDLFVDKNFFHNLNTLSHDENIGVIAPKICSINNGDDLNPKILNKPTRKKIEIMKFICSNMLLFSIHRSFTILRSKLYSRIKVKNTMATTMYGSHGAFMIFTRSYFNAGASIDYPRFLFGEEGFVAEELIKSGLVIQHVKSLVIYDKEHGSTSLISSRFLACEHYKSYNYYLDNYF